MILTIFSHRDPCFQRDLKDHARKRLAFVFLNLCAVFIARPSTNDQCGRSCKVAEEAVSSEPVSNGGNFSLFDGKIQGISRFCRLSSSIREANMPGIPRASRANSLNGRTGNFWIGTGKICGRSGKFIRRSGKIALEGQFRAGPGCIPRPSMAGLIG